MKRPNVINIRMSAIEPSDMLGLPEIKKGWAARPNPKFWTV